MSPTRRRAASIATAGATALLLAAVPVGARAAWTAPQDLGPLAQAGRSSALASNARGDAVAVLQSPGGAISVARARAHGAFGAPVTIAAKGYGPRVAIDERGVALIAFGYLDGTIDEPLDLREDPCCEGVKVAVWRPGHRPTRPRAVRRRGIVTVLGPLAATRGHRGVLIGRDRYGSPAPVRLVPVTLDGRLGRLRTVANASWTPTTLQWVGGRAVAGLARTLRRGGTRLAAARQRRGGAFNAVRTFATATRVSDFSRDSRQLAMAADGRGGQVAVYRAGRTPALRLVVARKPLAGRVRSDVLVRGRATYVKIAAPAVARDGSIVAPWVRRAPGGAAGFGKEHAYVTTRSAGGRLVTTRLLGPVTSVNEQAAAAAPRGRGAVSSDRIAGRSGIVTTLVALRAGRPLPGTPFAVSQNVFGIEPTRLTGNPQDPVRALFSVRGRALSTLLAP